jgi:DNA-binding GntR family transcriptional regulator
MAETTLTRRIARDLMERIRSGDLAPGDALPSEARLAADYGVNRLTVRHALSELVQQGLVITARGRRGVVAPPPVRYRLDDAAGASLASAMAAEGLDVRHEVFERVRVAVADAPWPLSTSASSDGRALVRFSYRRWVDGVPWSLSRTWLPPSLAPRSWSGRRPLLDDVAERHGLRIRRARRAFVAVPATLDDADQLDVPAGAPLLRVTGTSVDQDGRTVAVVRHRVRGDRAEYAIELGG